MSKGAEQDVPLIPEPARPGMEPERSWAVLRWLLVSAAAWFLLKELAPLLRPLLLAVFLAYLALILVEAGRLPGRMRAAFADEQAERLLTMVGTINAAIASYLKVKVQVNLVLAVPVVLIMLESAPGTRPMAGLMGGE